MPKPSDLFLRAIDLFAVLLPGALLVGLLWGSVGPVVDDRLTSLGSTARGAAFVVLSYVAGQISHAVGAPLDRGYFDRYRKGKGEQFYSTATREQFEQWRKRVGEGLSSERKAKPLGDSESLYKWAESQLRLLDPDVLPQVDRLQADSKFFRTFVGVLVVIAAHGFGTDNGMEVAAVVLIPVVVSRYFTLRLNAVDLVYRSYAVAIEHQKTQDCRPSNRVIVAPQDRDIGTAP